MRFFQLIYYTLSLAYHRAALRQVGGAHKDTSYLVHKVLWLEEAINRLFPNSSRPS